MKQSSEHNINELIKELRESKARYQALSETAIEGVFITREGYCIDVNLAGAKLLGYSKDEIIGQYVIQSVHPEDKEIALQMMLSKHEEPYNIRLTRKDNSVFDAEIRGKNYNYLNEGELRVVVVRDVTEHNNILHCLKESENKYRSLVEHAGDGILVGNTNGEIIEANQGFIKLSGYTKDELVFKRIQTIFTKESLEKKPLQFNFVDEGETIINERELLAKSGEIIPIETNTKKTNNHLYLTIIRDLRDRKKAQEELVKTNKELILAKEKAEESDRLKSAFLANMSHEIRTPMNGIIGFAELLKSPNINPETRNEYLNIILSSGHQLLNIINDILEISKIETGQISLERAPFSINELLNELLVFFKNTAQKYSTDIIVNTSKLQKDILYEDKSKIQQILTNLLSNALKFTKEGTINICIETTDTDTLFSVEDNGIGIAQENLINIFERFTQISDANVKKQKGTGLGLSICKKLIEMMNGKIWVQSEFGKGSSFFFSIPRIIN